jgi:hypothetical protein
MRRPVSVKSVLSFFLPSSFFSVQIVPMESSRLCRHPSIRTLFFERLSLGASWVYSIQQVLLPGNRPLFPLAKETGPGLNRSHLISAVEFGCLDTIPRFSLLLFLSSCLSQFFPEKFRARIA